LDRAAIEAFTNVVLDQLKSGFIFQMLEVGQAAGAEIVDPCYAMTFRQKRIAEMRSKKACGAGDEDAAGCDCLSVTDGQRIPPRENAGNSFRFC